MKNSKGITLVALVVTIIVLLILAGVSLSLVAGGDGIITRASNAAQRNAEGVAKEQTELLVAELATNYYEERYANATYSNVDGSQSTVLAGIAGTNTTKDGIFTVTISAGGTISVTGAPNGTTVSLSGTITDTAGITWGTPSGS